MNPRTFDLETLKAATGLSDTSNARSPAFPEGIALTLEDEANDKVPTLFDTFEIFSFHAVGSRGWVRRVVATELGEAMAKAGALEMKSVPLLYAVAQGGTSLGGYLASDTFRPRRSKLFITFFSRPFPGPDEDHIDPTDASRIRVEPKVPIHIVWREGVSLVALTELSDGQSSLYHLVERAWERMKNDPWMKSRSLEIVDYANTYCQGHFFYPEMLVVGGELVWSLGQR